MCRAFTTALSIAIVLTLFAPLVFAADPLQMYHDALQQAMMWQEAFMKLKAQYDTDTVKLQKDKEDALALYDEAEADIDRLIAENKALRETLQAKVDEANRKLEEQAEEANTKIGAIVDECNAKLAAAEKQYGDVIRDKDRLIQMQDATIKQMLSREKWGWLLSGILGTVAGTLMPDK